MHLSTEELRRWYHEGADADRDRVVTHVGVCGVCAARLAEVARTEALDHSPHTLNPADFVGRGDQFAPTPLQALPVSAGRRFWPLAAAAVLVLGVSATLWLQPDTPAAVSVLRGDDAPVSLVSPDDNPGTPVDRRALAFAWTSAPDVEGARLIVTTLETPDRPAIEHANVSSGYRPTPEELAALQPGVTYRWFVEYRSSAGLRVTPARRFRVE